MQITKRIEFDAGHRLLQHSGKCRNYHGHRYAAEFTISGIVQKDGMTLDFGIVKEKLGGWIDNFFDHGMLLQTGDPLLPILEGEGLKVYEMDEAPSAENIALHLYTQAVLMLENVGSSSLRVENVRVYETPSCWADYDGDL